MENTISVIRTDMQLGEDGNKEQVNQQTSEGITEIKAKENVGDDVNEDCNKETNPLQADNVDENAAPIGLDAIAPESTVVKSTEQEVINMLLAQHGILNTSGSLDVAALASHSNLTLETSAIGRNGVDTDDHKTNDIDLPTMAQPANIDENASTNQEAADEEQATELSAQSAEDGSHAYLTSISPADIGEQIAANAGYEVTAFVAEDGQGGHIIISGGAGYQDGSVVSISGHQVVSTVTDNQLMTLAGSDNVSVSMAGLENFASENVRISSADGDDESPSTPYYVLEGSVSMPDVQNQIDSNDNDLPKKVYQCSMEGCQKQFSTPYRLKAHGRSHTGRTFPCEENGCHKTFITPSDLNKHSRTHTGDKPFFCDVENCGKVYSTAHHLKVHKRSHTGDKPFVCEWDSCGKSFSTGYGLKSHYRTHTGERPYKCPETTCDKAFKTSGDLQKHVRTHTGERPFKCLFDGCSRSFTTSNIRKVHMRTHTGERPYVCEIEGCDRSFASATNYKNHSRIHTGERPYACEAPGCNKSFTEYSSLYKHNVVHTQQKPYICNICHKTYRQTSTLAMHKRTVHGATEDSNTEAEHETPEDANEDMEPSAKRQKVAFDSSSALTTALVQSLPVMLNDEGSMTAFQAQYAELAAQQQLTDGTSLSGAIAIPIQVTMNPDGTIAGAHGINLTDNTGRIIPVSLSLSLPISSFANSLSETHNDDSIVTSEAVAAASAVNEIFSNQQDQTGIDVQLTSDHVITEQIDNTNVISRDDEPADGSLKNEDGNERQQKMVSDAMGNQILITTVTDANDGLTNSDTTTVRIAPRDYSDDESKVNAIKSNGNSNIPGSRSSNGGSSESVVAMIIDDGITQEQEEGDVTDRYLIKESLEVHEKAATPEVCNV